MTIGEIIAEPLNIQKRYGSKEETREHVLKVMEVVGLNPKYYNRYPHEFSGGQRQRIGIARAFLHNSEVILLDEPTSNLDSLNEAEILKVLKEQQKDKTIILVSHRQSTMKIADCVIRMKEGRAS